MKSRLQAWFESLSAATPSIDNPFIAPAVSAGAFHMVKDHCEIYFIDKCAICGKIIKRANYTLNNHKKGE